MFVTLKVIATFYPNLFKAHYFNIAFYNQLVELFNLYFTLYGAPGGAITNPDDMIWYVMIVDG